MFVVRKMGWLSQIFVGKALPRIWLRALTTTTIASVVTVLHVREHLMVGASLTALPFTLIGVPLGIFLGFRNNTSYDRFWEGRRLWGGLVNTSRSLGRQILTLIEASALYVGDDPVQSLPRPSELAVFQKQMIYRLIAFVHALRLHLRGQRFDELKALLPPEEYEALSSEKNVPTAIVFRMAKQLQLAWHRGWVHPQHLPVFESSLVALTDIQGACERIKNTPIPFSYTVLLHRLVAFYCLALPFGIIEQVKVLTPVVVLLMSYAFFGLDAVGSEVEDPFGTDINDLPLGALSTTIEINLRQRLGEVDLPPLPAADADGVLL